VSHYLQIFIFYSDCRGGLLCSLQLQLPYILSWHAIFMTLRHLILTCSTAYLILCKLCW